MQTNFIIAKFWQNKHLPIYLFIISDNWLNVSLYLFVLLDKANTFNIWLLNLRHWKKFFWINLLFHHNAKYDKWTSWMLSKQLVPSFKITFRTVGTGGQGVTHSFWQISVPYINQEDRLYPPHYYLPSWFSDPLTALLSQTMSEIVFIASKWGHVSGINLLFHHIN